MIAAPFKIRPFELASKPFYKFESRSGWPAHVAEELGRGFAENLCAWHGKAYGISRKQIRDVVVIRKHPRKRDLWMYQVRLYYVPPLKLTSMATPKRLLELHPYRTAAKMLSDPELAAEYLHRWF